MPNEKVNNDTGEIRQVLNTMLPPLVSRKEVSRLTGNLLTPKTLANMDAKNMGPARKMMIGKQVVYFKEDFIDFFIKQVQAG